MPIKKAGIWISKFVTKFTARLANKLVLIFSISVSIFIVMLILISYFRDTSMLTKDFIDNNRNNLKIINQNLINYINQIDDFSLTPRKDLKFMSFLGDEDYYYENETYMQSMIRNMFNIRQDIESIRFYAIESKKEIYISRLFANTRIDYDVDRKNEAWYQKSISGKFFRYIESIFMDPENSKEQENKKVFFTFHRTIINIPDKKPLGIISISFDYTLMNLMIDEQYSQNGEIVCIFNKNDELFYSSSTKQQQKFMPGDILKGINGKNANGNFKKSLDGTDYLVVYNISEDKEWKTAKFIPIKMLNEKVRQTRDLSLMMGGIFILLFVVLIIFVSNIITGPLRKLSKQMDRVGSGNFKAKAEIRGNDEIAHLADKFNSMVVQIDDLVNDKYMAEINEKTARLKALEAQVNPHFLYNSLQAIASKAILSGMKDISKMIEALAYTLRYCIKGGDMVRISNEIENIKNYLILHKARYEERLSVEINVEDGTRDVMIPKLSIHTLVENSIKHCLESITFSILIKIHCYIEKDRIIILVTDNGPGMLEKQLEHVRNEMNDTNWLGKNNESIGLKNLNSRLRLMYENDAYVEIDSIPGQGTETRIVLPFSSKVGEKDV